MRRADMIEATEETPCHEWCNQLRDTIDALTAERDRYRESLEQAERVVDEVLAQPMPGGMVDLHGGGELRSRLVDARTVAHAALNPPKEPT
jgi:hypothetical protein